MQYVASPWAKLGQNNFGLAQNFWWRTHIFSCFAAETNLCTTFFGQMFAQSISNLCKPDNFYSKCINKETIFIFLQQILFYCDLCYFVAILILSWFTRFLRKILVCQIWIAQFFLTNCMSDDSPSSLRSNYIPTKFNLTPHAYILLSYLSQIPPFVEFLPNFLSMVGKVFVRLDE